MADLGHFSARDTQDEEVCVARAFEGFTVDNEALAKVAAEQQATPRVDP